jgi:hypothetical protein
MSSLKNLIQETQNIADRTPNPAQIFLEWKAGEGVFEFYDKELQEKVKIDKPIRFILLDSLATCRGWDSQNEAALIGTEVRNPATDRITLRSYYTENGEKRRQKLVEGLWKTDIKDNYPVDYYQSLYATLEVGDDLLLANIKVGRSGLSSLIKAKLKADDTFLITFSKGEEQKNGAAKWRALKIEKETTLPDGWEEQATSHYKELQAYLSQYLAPKPSEPQEIPEADLDEVVPDGIILES